MLFYFTYLNNFYYGLKIFCRYFSVFPNVENLEADDEIKPIAIWDNYRIFIDGFYDNESQKYGENIEFSDIPIIEQIKYMTKFNEDFFSENDDT